MLCKFLSPNADRSVVLGGPATGLGGTFPWPFSPLFREG